MGFECLSHRTLYKSNSDKLRITVGTYFIYLGTYQELGLGFVSSLAHAGRKEYIYHTLIISILSRYTVNAALIVLTDSTLRLGRIGAIKDRYLK